jgi:hypothetical protein
VAGRTQDALNRLRDKASGSDFSSELGRSLVRIPTMEAHMAQRAQQLQGASPLDPSALGAKP